MRFYYLKIRINVKQRPTDHHFHENKYFMSHIKLQL